MCAACTTTGDGAVSHASTSFRPGRAGPSTASGVITRPSASVTGLAGLEDPPLGARRHAERVGRGDVEASRPLVLDERVAERRDAVVEREGLDPVLAALELLARLELHERERIRQPAEERLQARRRAPSAPPARTP